MMEPCNCRPSQGRKPRFVSRRQFWMEAGMGIGGLGLIDLLTRDQLLGAASAHDSACSRRKARRSSTPNCCCRA